MTTASTIIRSALGKLGIVAPGESVKPGDAEDCLVALNILLDAWRVESLYAYTTQTVVATLLTGAQTVLIGPGAALDIAPRPVRIEGGFTRRSGTDWPFVLVDDDTWNGIQTKSVSGPSPAWVRYEPTLPSGTLSFFPSLSAGAEIHVDVQVQLMAFADLATDYPLPPGCERALLYSLAQEVAADFERELPPTVTAHAASARRLIKRANHAVPQLNVGAADVSNSSPAYLFGGI